MSAEDFQQVFPNTVGDGGVAGEYPAELARGMGDGRPAVLFVDGNDDTGYGEKWKETHAPDGIGLAVDNTGGEAKKAERAGNASFPAAEFDGDVPFAAVPVAFDGIGEVAFHRIVVHRDNAP